MEPTDQNTDKKKKPVTGKPAATTGAPKSSKTKAKGKKKPKKPAPKKKAGSKPDKKNPKDKDNRGPGRPTEYTEAIANEILERLAQGQTLRTICKDDHLPPESTVRWWVVTDREGFSAHYTRARDLGLDAVADELFDIADDGSNDLMTITKGDYSYQVENKEVTNRSRLRVDTRKWYLSKMAPKRYGEKVEHNFGNPLSVKTIRDDIPDSTEDTDGQG